MSKISLMKKFFLLFLLIIPLTGCSIALFNAAAIGGTDIAKKLLELGASVNEKNILYGTTPLHYATLNGHIDMVRLLLDKGADVNIASYEGITALHNAAANGYAEITRLLLDKGADVNRVDNKGFSALHRSTFKGNAEMTLLLLDNGADTDVKTQDGVTALHFASQAGHTKIVRLLLERDADFGTAARAMNGRMLTPLEYAEANGHKSIVHLLKEAESAASLKHRSKSANVSAVYVPQTSETEKKISSNLYPIPDFKSSPRDSDVAIIIGIEKYQGLPKSEFSKNDAGTVKDYFGALGFKERNIALLTDEKATFSGIKKTIETWLPNRIKKDSMVVVYYSGHGAPDITGNGYLVPFDGDPNYLVDTGYSLKRLTESLRKLESKEVVVLLDACFSGVGGRSVLATGTRPIVLRNEGLVLKENMVIISATNDGQISTSSPEKGHGVFTYYFLKALKDGKKDIIDIYEYLKPLVEDEAKTLNVEQSPKLNPPIDGLQKKIVIVK